MAQMEQARVLEFRRLFGQEAEERLDAIGDKLLSLEADGPNEDLVTSIFREAHNLKGAAAVVGLDSVSEVAHAMEDILEGFRSRSSIPAPGLIDILLGAVDGLRGMVPEAVEGTDCAAESRRLTALLGRASWPAGLADMVDAPLPEPSPGDHQAPPARPAPPAPEARPSHGDVVRMPAERLDEMVRLVGEAAAAQLRLGRALGEDLGTDPSTVSEFRDVSLALTELHQRSMRAQMVPFSTITEPLRRAVRDLARQLGKEVRLEVRGEGTELDRTILQRLSDPLGHLVRNAIDHGIESPAARVEAGKPAEGSLRLHAMQIGSEVVIAVTDDGRGIDVQAVRARAARGGLDVAGMSDQRALELVFRSGVSTAQSVSEVSGRGVGLDVVREGVEMVRGRIEVSSEPGIGTEFRISVPITLTILPCLMVFCGHHRFAIPMHSVVAVLPPDSVTDRAAGQRFVMVEGQALPLSDLADTLGLTPAAGGSPTVILNGLTRRRAFTVDGLVGQRDVVLRSLGGLLPRLDAFSGASVEPDGTIMLVLDPAGLVDRGRDTERDAPAGLKSRQAAELATLDALPSRRLAPDILVVDDALTVRELQRSILERGGYTVRTAADGLQALSALAERPADLVLTDVEMPNMDGFALTEAIRANQATAHLPVIIVTTQGSDDYRRRGLEVGADGYIVKSAFDSVSLIEAVERLLGPPAA